MVEYFPSMKKYINLHIQEAEQTPNRVKPKKFISGYIIGKFLKMRNQVLKAAREEE